LLASSQTTLAPDLEVDSLYDRRDKKITRYIVERISI